MERLPLIVFSHLRWDFVFQRPQHLLSRLAKQRRILFVEEPLYTDGRNHWETRAEGNVLVCCPHTNLKNQHGFTLAQNGRLVPMVRELLEAENIYEYGIWAYTPMCQPLVAVLSPEVVIFDVMDELSSFRGAPREMLDHEESMLQIADLVFTGGPSLYRAKRGRHANIHCFPSSVDLRHFSPRNVRSDEPEAQRDLPHPRLGFFGVIDERMDLDLLAALAAADPQWQIVMVGPVVKIDPRDLPHAPNLHYLGQQSYADLPAFLAGWDVCLLPFALNEATRFISPTKTLEYMAMGKPIVSTAVPDVADIYSGIVMIGNDAQQFIDHCRRVLAITAADWMSQEQKMKKILAGTSWDATARAMELLIEDAIQVRHWKSKAHALKPEAQVQLSRDVA